jgi:hypothetical protein
VHVAANVDVDVIGFCVFLKNLVKKTRNYQQVAQRTQISAAGSSDFVIFVSLW